MATKAALKCAAVATALMCAIAAAAQTPAPQPEPSDPAASGSQPAKPKPAKPASKPENGREKEPAAASTAQEDPALAQAECAWVGKRVVSLLVRDDVDTASDFTRFYAMFRCPEAHIAATLACVVSDPGAAREGAALTEHVDLCWANPTTRLLPQKPPNPDRPAPAAGKQ